MLEKRFHIYVLHALFSIDSFSYNVPLDTTEQLFSVMSVLLVLVCPWRFTQCYLHPFWRDSSSGLVWLDGQIESLFICYDLLKREIFLQFASRQNLF